MYKSFSRQISSDKERLSVTLQLGVLSKKIFLKVKAFAEQRGPDPAELFIYDFFLKSSALHLAERGRV